MSCVASPDGKTFYIWTDITSAKLHCRTSKSAHLLSLRKMEGEIEIDLDCLDAKEQEEVEQNAQTDLFMRKKPYGHLQCVVCSATRLKYKCPVCKEANSCSLQCFKEHKESCRNSETLQVEASAVEKSASDSSWSVRLDEDQKAKLDHSSSIRLALRNSELRRILKEVDSSADSKAALERAMDSNAFFADFINEMLEEIKR